MCHPSKTNIAISKYDAWKMNFVFDMVPEFRGTCQFSGIFAGVYLAGIQGAAVGLGSQPGCGFNSPWRFLRPKTDPAAKAKMTRYLKGWKRILDKDNTNRCNWYEFQDAEMKLHGWFFFLDGVFRMIVEKMIINRPSASFLDERLIKCVLRIGCLQITLDLNSIHAETPSVLLDLAGGLPGPWFSWKHWWRLACFRWRSFRPNIQPLSTFINNLEP